MQRNFTVIAIALFVCARSSAQEPDDPVAPPPVVEELAVEAEVGADLGIDFWIAPLFTGTTDTVSEYFRRGHVCSEIDFAALSVSDKAFQTDGDFVVTPRFQLGWESESGVGVRGRYWEFENDGEYNQIDREISSTLLPGIALADSEPIPVRPTFVDPNEDNLVDQSVESFELDLSQRFLAGRTDVRIGAGLKSVSRQESAYVTDLATYSENQLITGYHLENVSVQGTGLSLFSEFEHPLLVRDRFEVAFVLGGRSSYVPAEYEAYGTDSSVSLDDNLWINEGNVGLELLSRHRYITMRLRGQFETQSWNSSVTDNQAFTGTSLSFGIDW